MMPVIQIFAKPPVEGKVKTRLINDIGAAKATKIYQFCLEYTLSLVKNTPYQFELWLTEETTDSFFGGQHYKLQKGKDLGARMHNAINTVLTKSPKSNGYPILIGTDCLDLTESHLEQAVAALDSNDLVLLPALDGGFALIGCRKIDSRLFNHIKWSSEVVLKQLLDNAQTLKYQVHLLESVRDVDTLLDLNQYAELKYILAAD
jgi:rSAM/selenodomain-associated transferase 1